MLADLRSPWAPGVNRSVLGRVFLGIGVVGVVLSLVGIVAGLRLLSQLEGALDDSLTLTAEALEVVDASVGVTDDAVGSVTEAIGRTEATTRRLSTGIDDAVVVLDATADLTEDDLAGTLESVEGTLPALIDVAAVIDRTLSALSAAPFGPNYDPDERFDDSLRSIQGDLDGLPESLREQAGLVRDASASLSDVGSGTVAIADDLAELEVALREAGTLLDEYSVTATDARALVDDRRQELEGGFGLSRVLVVALGLTILTANLVSVGAGWLLSRTDVADRLG